eukprot:Sspe_Gene.30139::Locus_14764_Transcript_1_10_Confidence_0.154_Length_1917::g.30139::m.30139
MESGRLALAPPPPPDEEHHAHIDKLFDDYQTGRIHFIQTVADLASRPHHAEVLHDKGIMALLKPLLMDPTECIHQSAALALGRLASSNPAIAEQVVQFDILPVLVACLRDKTRGYKKSACYVLRAVAKHSPQLAQACVEARAVEHLVGCLEDIDVGVKEGAAWALGYLAKHSAEVSLTLLDNGAAPLLAQCATEPDVNLKRVSLSTLSEIVKHTPLTAQRAVDDGVVGVATSYLTHGDLKVKRHVCQLLTQVAKHTIPLAEAVIDAEAFPRIYAAMGTPDETLQKNAAACVREVVKHSPELATLVVNTGGLAPLVACLSPNSVGPDGGAALPAVMALGYVAAFNGSLSMAVIRAKGVPPIISILEHERLPVLLAAASWAVGVIASHSPEHSRAATDSNALPVLMDIYLDQEGTEDTRLKARKAFKAVCAECHDTRALEPLLHPKAPPEMLKYILAQYALLLPHDLVARRDFVANRGLAVVQSLVAPTGTKLHEHVEAIRRCYPKEIVEYYDPLTPSTFLQKVDQHRPSIAT